MDKLSASSMVALVLAALYGLTSLVGGIIGFVKAGSVPSIVAGGISGLLLLGCAAAMSSYPKASLITSLVVAVALIGNFEPRVFGLSDKPAGAVHYVMTAGGVVVVIATAIALVVLLNSSPKA